MSVDEIDFGTKCILPEKQPRTTTSNNKNKQQPKTMTIENLAKELKHPNWPNAVWPNAVTKTNWPNSDFFGQLRFWPNAVWPNAGMTYLMGGWFNQNPFG